jgi:transcriptional regulator with XRE-family HTH domain/DNA-binding transcriptional ArsR family regulator
MSESISENIRHFRRERHLKQSELAAMLGVTVQAVSRWENGGAPDISLLPSIADTLHVSIDALFGRDAKLYEDPLEGLMVKIRSLPEEERYHTAYEAAVRIMISVVGSSSVDQLFNDPMHIDDSSASSFMINGIFRDGFVCGNLSPKKHYLFMSGTHDYSDLPDRCDYSELFSCLSDPDTLKLILFFLHQKNYTGCTLSYLCKNTGLSKSTALHSLDIMKKQLLVDEKSYVDENEEVRTWELSNPLVMIALLITAADLPSQEGMMAINLSLNSENAIKPLISDSNNN